MNILLFLGRELRLYRETACSLHTLSCGLAAMEMPWCALTTASRGNNRKPAACCDFNIHLEKQSSAGGEPHYPHLAALSRT